MMDVVIERRDFKKDPSFFCFRLLVSFVLFPLLFSVDANVVVFRR
jgi:hypothetical protein